MRSLLTADSPSRAGRGALSPRRELGGPWGLLLWVRLSGCGCWRLAVVCPGAGWGDWACKKAVMTIV